VDFLESSRPFRNQFYKIFRPQISTEHFRSNSLRLKRFDQIVSPKFIAHHFRTKVSTTAFSNQRHLLWVPCYTLFSLEGSTRRRVEHLRGVGSHAWRREASGLLFQRCRRCVGRVVGVGPSEQMEGETKGNLKKGVLGKQRPTHRSGFDFHTHRKRKSTSRTNASYHAIKLCTSSTQHQHYREYSPVGRKVQLFSQSPQGSTDSRRVRDNHPTGQRSSWFACSRVRDTAARAQSVTSRWHFWPRAIGDRTELTKHIRLVRAQ